MEFIVISGLSGAGKSQAGSVLEDIGYFVMDNMPAPLISRFAELCMAGQAKYDRVAIVCDSRGGQTSDRHGLRPQDPLYGGFFRDHH